jgi:hypothetical protein
MTDPGVTDKRLFVVESEFANTLKVLERETNTLSPKQSADNGAVLPWQTTLLTVRRQWFLS